MEYWVFSKRTRPPPRPPGNLIDFPSVSGFPLLSLSLFDCVFVCPQRFARFVYDSLVGHLLGKSCPRGRPPGLVVCFFFLLLLFDGPSRLFHSF